MSTYIKTIKVASENYTVHCISEKRDLKESDEGYEVYDCVGCCINEGNIVYHLPDAEMIKQMISVGGAS